MIQTETCAVMNGFKNGNSSNSSPGFGSGNSGGGGSDIKYPANCSASRFSNSIQGLGFGASTECAGGGDELDQMYNPKRNKKIFRIVTVMGYIFSVSTVAILLSLYYLFLWDPYIKGLKTTSTTATPTHQPMSATNASFRSPGEVLSEPELSTVVNSLRDETATKFDQMLNDYFDEALPGDLSTTKNPFTAYNKAQKVSNKNRGSSPTCKQCNS